MMRALIVNGDDFGLTPGVNAGILRAHTHGILTSASLLANAAATGEAIAIARQTTTLDVGCHLALVDGAPVLPASELPTLAPGGRFRLTWSSFIRDALLGRIRLPEIERELSAQIGRLIDGGIRVTHLDSHKHVHAYPPVFAIVARLARRHAIDWIRIPSEPSPVGVLMRYAPIAGARRQAVENLALAPWAALDRKVLRDNGLPPAPAFLGRALTGLLTPARFHALVATMAGGSSELMMHPGFVDAALDRVRTRLRREREMEVELLTSRAARDIVERAGITLMRRGALRGSPFAPSAREPVRNQAGVARPL